jgi:hypothetical protein
MDTMNQENSGHKIPLALAVTALLLLIIALPLQAGVVARLSTTTTGLDQPFQLTLETEGEQTDPPDLSVLDDDFEILGRATQQSVSIINGSVSSKRSLILTLLPKRPGKLTIPSIPFGDLRTAPLSLEITAQPSDNASTTPRQQAQVELSLNKASAYPEEEVILILKLYIPPGVRGEHLDQPTPSLGDTRVQLLDESNYPVERNGLAYQVLERSYGLYAYQTGKLEIAPVTFRGRSGGRSVFNLFDDPFNTPLQSSRLVRAKSNPVSLQIKPPPGSFTGQHWLPARNIQLVETGIDVNNPIVAGKPLTRRIMLIADGLVSSQLPALSPQVPDTVKTYEERPQLQDTPRRTGISSSRESLVTLIPTQAGEVTLPAIEIPWWNTETGKQEIARLPEVTLTVIAAAASDTPAAGQPSQSQTTDKPLSQTQEPVTPAPPDDPDEVHWLVWLLAAAWLATLAGWWLTHRKRRQLPATPVAVTRPSTSADQSLAAVIDALAEAYHSEDAEAARDAWLRWGQCRWPQNPPNNLTRLAGRSPKEVAEAVISLEKALYSPDIESGWADRFNPLSLNDKTEQPSTSQPANEQLLPLNP